MRIAVTGASGFVGGRIARALAATGHHVISYGRRATTSLVAPLPNYQVWDLDDAAAATVDVDAVVHCAALVGDWGRDSDYRRVNVDGSATVLRRFTSAKRIVHVSTSSVYSRRRSRPRLRESDPTGDCLTAYGRSKAAAESLVMRIRPDAIVLRPHIVYGPGDATLLPRIVAAARFGQLAIPGTGTNLLSATHVDNLVTAVERALVSDASGAFNIADANPAPVSEILRAILLRSGVDVSLRYVPRHVAWAAAAALEIAWPTRHAPRGPPLTRYLVSHFADEHTLDLSRARNCLGYDPTWTHVDGPL